MKIINNVLIMFKPSYYATYFISLAKWSYDMSTYTKLMEYNICIHLYNNLIYI